MISIRCLIGIFLTLSSVLIFKHEQKYSFLCIIILIGGLICFPIIRRCIENLLGFKLSRFLKYEIVLFSGILSIIFNGKIEDSNTLKKQKSLVNEGSFFVQEQKNEEKVDFNQEKKLQQVKLVPQNEQNVLSSINTEKAKRISGIKGKEKQKGTIYQRNKSIKSNKSKKKSEKQYIRGPRGGCYYINSKGNKTYVDRSLCN